MPSLLWIKFARIGAWLEQLDRDHYRIVSPAGHVHAIGRVEAVDMGPGTITLWNAELRPLLAFALLFSVISTTDAAISKSST